MAIKIKIPRGGSKPGAKGFSLQHPLVKIGLIALLAIFVVGASIFSYYWLKFDRIVEKRIRGPIFSNSAKIYARARMIEVGDKADLQTVANELRRTGYIEAKSSTGVGSYELSTGEIAIHPGPLSFHNEDGAVIKIAGGTVKDISGLGAGKDLSAYELEPPLLTSLDSEERSKRQVVHYQEIPKILVDATLAIEDRRFFQHGGVNFLRLASAAYYDVRSGGKEQGASTITMQISRGFFLTRDKTFKRKLVEMMIAMNLEQKLTKQQIFELYANQVDMGQRGSFTIHGFAEASRAYFNKDLRGLSLPEAALLAGMVQRPSYLNPYRHPERALERRNLVLDSMVETGTATRDQADHAKATPLNLAPPNVEASDAPYFVDLVKDLASSKYGSELNDQALKIYTTLDPDLQRAAAEAVQAGMKQVDEQLVKLRTRKKKIGTGKTAKVETTVIDGPMAQVALVAIDPHTGEVLALVGGRNYGFSQLNHAIAKRPTGSIFKPFVYATAMNSAIVGNPTVLTPSTVLDDSPSSFVFDDGRQTYEPHNYKAEYHGEVTLQYALAHSLNNATVKLAEQIGYDNVAKLAHAAGIKSVQATPAAALGAYDATPLDMAGAYTVFANEGKRIAPLMVKSVQSSKGDVLESFKTQETAVLDPRIAYVMTSMMEGVVNTGTGYTVRQFGFTAPAAGKTGTSHDGWFAGYTSNLLCIVWVGFDDYSDLKLAGSTTAAPVWAEFMKRAAKLSQYRSMSDFEPPSGVVDVKLDKLTNRLATTSCPDDYTVAFIAGTEPLETCDQNPDQHKGFLNRIFGAFSPNNPSQQMPNSPGVTRVISTTPQVSVAPAPPQPQTPDADPEKKKKGFFGKLFGSFKDDKADAPKDQPDKPPAR